MADTKISALTGATTPLAGTEVVPLVQSSTTKNVSVANLTAGRAVSASTLSLSSSAGSNNLVVERATVGGFAVTADTGGAVLSPTIVEGIQFYDKAVSVRAAKLWTDTGNLNLYTGNLVIGTSGKGIDFSATSDAAGMTSELLSDYEEGTWTPSLGGTTTYTAQNGTYTKVGRSVTVRGTLLINSIGTGAPGTISGLPYTVASGGIFGITIGYISTASTSFTYIGARTNGGTTDIKMIGTTGSAAGISDGFATFTNSTYLEFSGTYFV